MGEKINLTADQEGLKQHLKENYNYLIEGNIGEAYNDVFKEMTELAFQLATSLTTPPVFTQDILNGARDLTPTDRDFYNHLHVIEDLLNYLEDDEANNPPADVTLNETFEFRVHTNRWGHDEVIHLTRNETGWEVSAIGIFHSGNANIEAGPHLYDWLLHESVSYPYNLNGYMAKTWQNASNGASREEIQEQLNAIARWLSETERNKPYTL